MNSLARPLLASWVLIGLLYSSDQPKLSPEQQAVIHAHNVIRDSARKRDFKAWSSSVAEDCIFSDDDGNTVTKVQFIDHMRNLPFEYDHSEDQRDFVAHVYGDTAVLNLRFTGHEQFTDTDILSEMRETETFVKQNGTWVLVARHWGMLPVNFRKPVSSDASTYKDYVGQFEWRPGLVDAISLESGKLLTKMSGEAEGEEYLPAGPDAFFLKDDLGEVTFSRDAQGQVTGYVYHRVDGQQIRARKIH